MKKNTQKGFTLILSLVLLLVMSLMGGALIVISSGDHQSNNSSDQYQQTFYVAEHALIEAEKSIINKVNNKKILAPAGMLNHEISLNKPISKNETINTNSKIDAFIWF